MLDLIYMFIVRFMDYILGWLLYLPKDVVLFVVSIGTSLILTVVRVFTTNQDLLKRCDEDKKILKGLIKEAKKQKDKEAVLRYKNVMGMIALKPLKQEGLPLLAIIIPMIFLGSWCLERIGFYPPKAGEVIEVNSYFPASAEGQTVHIVPQENIKSENGWIQEISTVTAAGPAYGMATWKLQAKGSSKPYNLEIRYKNNTYYKSLLVGQKIYEPAVQYYNNSEITCSEVKMKEVKLFNIVPGIPAWALPPWVIAYLIIVIPFVSILKHYLKIY